MKIAIGSKETAIKHLAAHGLAGARVWLDLVPSSRGRYTLWVETPGYELPPLHHAKTLSVRLSDIMTLSNSTTPAEAWTAAVVWAGKLVD